MEVEVNRSIKITMPFYTGYSSSGDDSYNKGVVKELICLSQKIPFYIGDEPFYPDIFLVSDEKNIKKLHSYFHHNNSDKEFSSFVCFNFLFPKTIRHIEAIKEKLNINSNLAYHKHLLGQLDRAFTTFFLMLNLARPGGSHTGKAHLAIKGKKNDIFHFINEINGSAIDGMLWNHEIWDYPNRKDLDILRTWDWFISNSDLLYGKITTPISRGLHSFFNILDNSSNMICGLHLLWAMIGIEAIFTDENLSEESITHQILTRSHLMFGDVVTQKDIKTMYKIRSKFLHGKLNSSILTENIFEEEKIMDRYHMPIYESAQIATTLLVLSLQYAISRGWNDIKFHRATTLSGGSSIV